MGKDDKKTVFEREVDMTSAEQDRWQDLVIRRLVGVAEPVQREGKPFVHSAASGVLFRIADRDFVFTAGHCITRPLPSIAATFFADPNRVIDLLASTGGAIDKWLKVGEYTIDSDAGILELDPTSRFRFRHYQPLTLDDVVAWQVLPKETRVMVVGFPQAKEEVGPADLPPMKIAEGYTTLRARTLSRAIPCVTRIQHDIATNPYAYEGKGRFHVGWDHIARSTEGHDFERIDPKGVSGGPVLVVDEPSPRFIGIVRASFEDRALLCEPAITVVKLLLDHSDEHVRAAVEACVERLARGPVGS